MSKEELEKKVIRSLREGFDEEEIVQAMRDDGYSGERTRDIITEAEERMQEGRKSPGSEPDNSENRNSAEGGSAPGNRDSMIETWERPDTGAAEGRGRNQGVDVFKKRNPLLVVVLSLATFGIYVLYWFYSINKEFKTVLDDGSHPVLRALGIYVPFVNLYVFYKVSRSFEKATEGISWSLALLGLIAFFPVGQYLMQRDINSTASG